MSHEVNTHRFEFDYVFDETATNEAVFREAAMSLVDSFLDRGRATLFAYGQTGSGKTHTIFGTQKVVGVYEHVCKHIIEKLNGRTLTICFVEIYGNRVYDLFENRNRVELLEDGNGNAQLVGQTEITIVNLNQMMELIRLGMECRTTGSTEANAHSSRSHAIVQMTIRNDAGGVESKFSLVDLAGSERGVDTGNIDKRARQEGSEINKSLLALKECIRALYLQRTNKETSLHIPFRASKLTQILRDSFIGKNSQTSMIAMISPGSLSAEHSLNTLRYADRVKEFKKADSKLDALKSPTEKHLIEPEYESIEPVIDQFDDLDQLSKSFMSIENMSMGSSFSVTYETNEPAPKDFVPSNLQKMFIPSMEHTSSPTIPQVSRNPNGESRSMTPIAQIGFPTPQPSPLQVDINEVYDSVIQLHLESIAKAGQLARKERAVMAEQGDVELDRQRYCGTMLEILDERIEMWIKLRKKMIELHKVIN
jgi:hypothetical protein